MKWLVAVALCLIPAMSRADDAIAYERAVSSVVGIVCTMPNGGVSQGTGVILVTSKFELAGQTISSVTVVTAEHVIAGATTVEAIFPVRDSRGMVIGNPEYYAGRRKPCEIIGTSHARDLALLRVFQAEDAEAISMAWGVRPGEQVFTIGAGSGVFWHYAAGSVRQVYNGGFRTQVADVKSRLVEMTTPINPGDSGGPIINKDGQLVGINLATRRTNNQVHLGIEVSEVRAFAREALLAAIRAHSRKQE